MRSPAPFVLLAFVTFAHPAPAQTWRVGDRDVHIVARHFDQRSGSGRAAMLARVARAAAALCRHEPIALDRRACADATIADTARRYPALRLALAERDASVLAARSIR